MVIKGIVLIIVKKLGDIMKGKDVLLYITTGLAIIGFLGAFTEVPEAIDTVWTLVSNTAFFNGNSEVTGDSQASSFTLNGTSINDWSAVNQSSSGSSFVYNDYFDQSLNTSDNVSFNKVNTSKLNIGMEDGGLINVFKESTLGDPASSFNVNVSAGLGSALSFKLKVPSHTLDTGTVAAIGVSNDLTTYKDRSGATILEGIRNNIYDSVVHTKGTNTYKGVSNLMSVSANSGGTSSIYGVYTVMPQFIIFSGNPVYNSYGEYIKSGASVDLASATINRYGIYLDDWACSGFDDACYGIYDDGGKWRTLGSMQANDYFSGDGTQGMTGTCGSGTTLTVKDGLITGCS